MQRTNGAPNSGGGGGAASTVVPQGLILRGIDNTIPNYYGTTDFTVARFITTTPTVVGAVPLSSWVTITDSPTLGTTFDILQPGIYACLWYVAFSGNDNAMWVSYNAPVGIRQGTGQPFVESVYSGGFQFSTSIQTLPGSGQAIIPVPQADITAGAATIRAQYSDVGVSPPLAASFIAPADVALRIFRIGDMA